MPNAYAEETKRVSLIGGGGHALVVADALLRAGISLAGIFDDSESPRACGRLNISRLGRVDAAADAELLHLAVGDLAARARILKQLSHRWFTVIDPESLVSQAAQVLSGAFVGARAVINSHARIGAHTIINTGVIVEHECDIGENSHIAPGVILGGNVRIGSHTLVGTGARVLPGVDIGNGCTVGAGAVVTRDVPDNTTVVGVPARVCSR